LDDPIGIGESIVVPKAHNPETGCLQPSRRHGSPSASPAVLAAIDLADQARREARKVDRVRPERDLAREAKAIELPVAQSRPQALLGLGGIAAERARYRRGHDPAPTRP
jgi:hypothetical protein